MKFIPVLLTLLFTLFLGTSDLASQTFSVEDEDWFSVQDSGTIYGEKGVIAGHYLLTTRALEGKEPDLKAEKDEDAGVIYVLTLLDQNLNLIGESTLPYQKGLNLMEMVYTGKYLVARFTNSVTDERWLSFITGQGQVERTFEYTDWTLRAQAEYSLSQLRYYRKGLIPVSGGLVAVGQYGERKGSFTRNHLRLEYFPNDTTAAGWVLTPFEYERAHNYGADVLAVNDDLALVHAYSGRVTTAGKTEQKLIGVDLETGTIQFTYRVRSGGQVQWRTARFVDDKVEVVGAVLDKDHSLSDSPAVALRRITLDMTGKQVDVRNVDILAELPKGSHKKDRLLVQDIGFDGDGNVFVAAEIYRRIMGSLQPKDGLTFGLNNEFKLTSTLSLDKGENGWSVVQIPYKENTGMLNPATIAHYANIYGYFDFRFLTESPRGGYSLYLMGSEKIEEDGNVQLMVARQVGPTVVRELMEFEDDIRFAIPIPAKPGYLGVLVRAGEKGSLELRLKRLGEAASGK